MLTEANVDRLIAGYDLVIDGTDTFETRYSLNDAAVRAAIPVVHASVFRFEGQLTVFVPFEGPCYRCLYPTPPPPELAPGCSVAGVLGVVPGVMGLLQATEAVKLILRHWRSAGRPAAHLGRARRHLHRARAAARSELPGVRRNAARGGCAGAAARRGVRPDRAVMTAVRLPPVLRQYAGDAEAGRRVRRARWARWSADLVDRHPGLRDQLLTSDGQLHRFVNVYLNGQDVRYLSGLDTPVGERDTVIVLPAMAGGQAEAQGASRRVGRSAQQRPQATAELGD